MLGKHTTDAVNFTGSHLSTSSQAVTMSSKLTLELGNDIIQPVLGAGSSSFEAAALIIERLLSPVAFVGEEEFSVGDTINDFHLQRRLFVLAMNGFPGLQNIRTAGILPFLIRRQPKASSMFEIIRSGPSPAAKSLAENIFRTAVAANNVSVVIYLLNHTNMIDVNRAVCHDQGQRYTPLELAAKMHSLEVARFLVEKQADVNKTLSTRHHHNALHLLINSQETKSVMSESFMDLINLFLEKGSTIPVECISEALRLYTDQRLSVRLLRKSAYHSVERLVSNTNLLTDIVTYLDEQDATDVIKLIIEKYSESLSSQHLRQFHVYIYTTLGQALTHGYNKQAETPFPHVYSLGEILEKPVMSGKLGTMRSIIKSIAVDLSPEVIEASSIDFLSGKEYRVCPQPDLPARNPLQVGDIQGNFEICRALTEAIQTRNLEDANRILDLDPDFRFGPREMYNLDDAFGAALADGNFHDIAWRILGLATTEIRRYQYKDNHVPLLCVAMEHKELEFVDFILDSGFLLNMDSFDKDEEWSILETAIDSGYFEKIFPDPGGVHFHISQEERILRIALQPGREDVLFYILDRDTSSSYLEKAIEVAVSKLIVQGVSLEDEMSFTEAMREYPSMIKPLLRRFSDVYPQGKPGYGWSMVMYAIKNYPENSWLVELFLKHSIIITDTPLVSRHPTALCTTIDFHPNVSLIKRLLDAGSNVNTVAILEYKTAGFYRLTTALLSAIRIQDMEVIRLLVQYNADINKSASCGISRTPLQKAAELNNLEIVEFLLDQGADVNAPPPKLAGATALQFAAINGNSDMVMMLIGRGARLDVPPPLGRYGRWPLEGAAENGRLDMIYILWEANGGPFDDKQCQNAKRLAERNGHFGCKDLIDELLAKPPREHGADFPMLVDG